MALNNTRGREGALKIAKGDAREGIPLHTEGFRLVSGGQSEGTGQAPV